MSNSNPQKIRHSDNSPKKYHAGIKSAVQKNIHNRLTSIFTGAFLSHLLELQISKKILQKYQTLLENDVFKTILLIFESKYSSQSEIELENCLIRPK